MIKKYEPIHRERCLEIFESNCPKFFDITEKESLLHWLDGQENNQNAYENTNTEYYYVIMNESEIIGCGGFYTMKDELCAKISWGMIDRNFHKKGFGRTLSLFRLKEIQEKYPNHVIALDTSQHTFPFYEKLGFITKKITPNSYGIGLDRYDMIMKAKQ